MCKHKTQRNSSNGFIRALTKAWLASVMSSPTWRPPILALLINQLTLVEAATVVSMLPVTRAVELFDDPIMRRRAAILEKLDPQRAAEILSGLSADERTDVIQKMGHHPRHLIVPRIAVEERKELEGLLQYPAHTAGGIMTTEFVQLDPNMIVSEALRHIRSVAREKESIYACYVMQTGHGPLAGRDFPARPGHG